MSWGPFAEGKNDYFNTPALVEIGKKYGKTSAQTALRFLLQKDVILIPKSVHKNRMEENFNIFDFSLNEEEMKKIENCLECGQYIKKCPYELNTPELLKKNYEDYKKVLAGEVSVN